MTVGVVVFPGTNCEADVVEAVAASAATPSICGTASAAPPASTPWSCPGGFAHGDYLRTGAIARFSPIMAAVAALRRGRRAGARDLQRLPDPLRGGTAAGRAAEERGPQVPLCTPSTVRVESSTTPRHIRRGIEGDVLRLPINHFEGNLHLLGGDVGRAAGHDQIVFRYVDNPNGSVDDIAGVCNRGAQRRRV